MNLSAQSKMLKLLGTLTVVLLPVVLALWFAHIRAMSETRTQLHSFAQLVLNKTELVIQQADLARDMAQLYQGKMCTPAHQKSMLNI
ncbi:MAG: CSS-motif domain-containing protein, partial [Acinetobacter sp.]